MRRRKRLNMLLSALPQLLLLLHLTSTSEAMLLLTTNCLALTLGCSCSWRSGKFVADCNGLNLDQVPKNDYSEYLMSKAAGNNGRDIQQLNLAANNISELSKAEFALKKFGNLQKLNLNSNRLARIHPEAFHKLTGLIDLDLSENALTKLSEAPSSSSWLLLLDAQSGSEEPPEVGAEKARHSEVAQQAHRHSSSSFLHSLSQLRILNLNSNQLNRLDKFAFSPVAQLRQLYLSRNQISSIDKLAFDGLDVLNILHLDGNKLSCLDGRILSQLPRLNAIQLAANPWLCDCHLRELVRSLGAVGVASGAPLAVARQQLEEQAPAAVGWAPHDSRSSSAAAAAGSSRRIQLVDEPACHTKHNGLPSQVSSMMIGGQEHQPGKLWKNMRLGEFACPPRLAQPLRRPLAGQWPRSAWELDAGPLDPRQIFSRKNMNMNDSEPSHSHGASLVELEEPLDLMEGEPVELTCAQELNDELELSEQTVEWWRWMIQGPVYQKAAPELLWRFSPPSSTDDDGPDSIQPQSAAVAALEGGLKGDKVAVIDYVTRANSSQASSDLNKSQEAAGYHQQQLELVRVTHLLELPADAANQTGGSAKPPIYYLCRIANQMYTLDLVYRVNPRSVTRETQLEAERSHSWRKAATSNFRLRDLTPPARSMGQLLSRVQLAKYQATGTTNSIKHLFVPIILPHQLTQALALTQLAGVQGAQANASTTSRLGALITPTAGFNTREPQQRSTVMSHRQTTSATNATSPNDYQMSQNSMQMGGSSIADEASADRLLGAAAIGLIHRYTSNRADLVRPAPAHLLQSTEPHHPQPVQVELTSKLANATGDDWHLQPATTSAASYFHSYSIILGLKKSNHWPILMALVAATVLLLTLWLSILVASRFKRSMGRQAEDLKRQEAREKPEAYCVSTTDQVGDTSTGKLAEAHREAIIEESSPCAALDYLTRHRDLDEESNDADLDESPRSHFTTCNNNPRATATLHHPLPPALFMLSSKSSDSDTQSCSCHHHQHPQPIISNFSYWSAGADCLTLGAAEAYQRQLQITTEHPGKPVKMLRFGPAYNGSLGRVAPVDINATQHKMDLERLEIGCILNHHLEKPPSSKEAAYNTSSNSTSGCYDPFPTPNSYSSSPHCDSSSGPPAPSCDPLHLSRCSKQQHPPREIYSQGSNANLVYLDEALRLLQSTVNEGGAPMPPFRHQHQHN